MSRIGSLLARHPLAAALAGVSLVAILIAAATVTRDRYDLLATTGAPPHGFFAEAERGKPVCQAPIAVPEGTARARVFVGTHGRPGPPLRLTVRDGEGSVLRTAALEPGYADAGPQVFSLRPLASDVSGAEVCVATRGSGIALAGAGIGRDWDARSTAFEGDRRLEADISLDLLRSEPRSLLSLAPTMFHRASLFRPDWVGPWLYYLLAGLALALVAASALILRAAGRAGTPAIVGAVAAVAFLNAATWSLVTPSFAVPDEQSHFAYTQSMVELGHRPFRRPGLGTGSYSPEEIVALDHTLDRYVGNTRARPPWSEAVEERWRRTQAGLPDRGRDMGGGFHGAANYSPLHYALHVPPYLAGRGEGIWASLWLMRMVGALLAAAAAAAALMFTRELVPSTPWLWAAAGLGVGLAPMFAFVGGGMNNDNLMFLCAAVGLWLMARAVRRGLTPWLGVAIGLTVGVGIVVKPGLYALVPLVLALAGGAAWARRGEAGAWRAPLAAVVALAAALGAGQLLFDQGELARATVEGAAAAPLGQEPTAAEFASYLWQWYLPPLWFMEQRFPACVGDCLPAYEIFFKGFWATFGWLEVKFAGWVYGVLIAFTVGLVTLAGYALVRHRRELPPLAPTLALLVGPVVLLALLVHVRSYLAFVDSAEPFAQGRYLLPAIPTFGAMVGLAALAAGRFRGRIAAVALVAALAWLNVFSLGLTLTRFYL